MHNTFLCKGNTNISIIKHSQLSDQWTTKPWNNVIGQINECDTEVKSGKIAISGCTDYFPEAKRIELKNGIYNARIYN